MEARVSVEKKLKNIDFDLKSIAKNIIGCQYIERLYKCHFIKCQRRQFLRGKIYLTKDGKLKCVDFENIKKAIQFCKGFVKEIKKYSKKIDPKILEVIAEENNEESEA